MSRARAALEHLRRTAKAVRDLFSIERQMSDEARAGWEDWLEETDPQPEGYYIDARGLGER